MSLSALCRKNLAPLGPFVARRDLGLLESHALVPDLEPVLAGRPLPLVSVEERLGADLGNRVVDQARLAIAGEEGVESLDVGIDGGLEGRVRRPVGRGVSEQILAAQRVVFVVPRLASAFGSHC